MDVVTQAFQYVERLNFLPDDAKGQASANAPVPIGFGQTNSQPYTVELMLRWLDVEPGNKILDVGSGSGWTTALLAYLTGPEGCVYAVEKVPELVEFGRANCEKTGMQNVRFFEAGNAFGLPEHAPFDRILVSASARELPQDLLTQLSIGGKMVIPVRSDILEITKTSFYEHETKNHSGFAFVPLI